jgi:hypothetical protein
MYEEMSMYSLSNVSLNSTGSNVEVDEVDDGVEGDKAGNTFSKLGD